NPTLYGVTFVEATQLFDIYEEFHDALTLAVDPYTRTKSHIADKDAKRSILKLALRQMSQRIKRNLALDPDDVVDLGIHLDDPTKTPRAAPATQPLLSIIAATPYQFTVQVVDAMTPNSRAQPFGSAGAL